MVCYKHSRKNTNGGKKSRHVGGRLKIRLNVRFFCKGGAVKIFLKILDNTDKNDVLENDCFLSSIAGRPYKPF